MQVIVICGSAHALSYTFFTYLSWGGFYPSNDFVLGVAVATDNSVFLLGAQDDFGTSGSEFATVKLDADGDFLWEWTVRLILD